MQARVRENPRHERNTAMTAAENRTATIERKTAETDVRLDARARRHGRGHARHGRRLPRPHARPARPPRAPGPRRDRQRRPADGRPPHRRGHRHRARPGARPGARRPRGHRPLRLCDRARWTRRARAARSTSPGAPSRCSTPSCPRAPPAASSTSCTEEFFRALANAAKLTLHLRVEAGSNAHHMIEAAFKAFARALRQAVAIDPTETGVPSTKGTLTA